MYQNFYKFKEKPFNLTPDPKYLYLSDKHREAMAHLFYGINERHGFVQITGEVGTGKTTLIRTFLNELGKDTEAAFIFNPNLSDLELLKNINAEFGIDSSANSKKELIDTLNNYLLKGRQKGKNIVLIIDEAQRLAPSVLEQIRLVSNLETETEKLLQIILVGQPELEDTLLKPALRQLNQRISVRYHLEPLNSQETADYIRHRIEIAGEKDRVRYTKRALKRIYRYSKGIPRVINIVCDRALLIGYCLESRKINGAIITKAINDIKGKGKRPFKGLILGRFLPVFLALSILFFFGYHWTNESIWGRDNGRFHGMLKAVKRQLLPTKKNNDSTEKRPVSREQPGENSGLQSNRAKVELVHEREKAVAKDITVRPTYLRKDRLIEYLMSMESWDTILKAVNTTLKLWKLELLDGKDFKSLNFFQWGTLKGLNCYRVWGGFNDIRNLGLPAILELTLSQGIKPKYIALIHMENDFGVIDLEKPEKILLETLEKIWFGSAYVGKAYIFWKDFEEIGFDLFLGKKAMQVEWLQKNLKKLGFYSGPISTTYDTETRKAVANFQKAHQLKGDGIFGPETRIIFYNSLGGYNSPRFLDKMGEDAAK